MTLSKKRRGVRKNPQQPSNQIENQVMLKIINTQYSNEQWHVDLCRLDIWGREFVGDQWEPCRIWIMIALDDHSRCIPGFVLSLKCPDAGTTAILLRQAILPKTNPKWANQGMPKILKHPGLDLLSNSIVAALAHLEIQIQPQPYRPNDKGKIERFFHTLDRCCLRNLPGYIDAESIRAGVDKNTTKTLLTCDQLMQEMESWLVEEFHNTEHPNTGRKPADLWQETASVRLPTEDELNGLR